MISIPLSKEQAGALVIAIFFLLVGAQEGISQYSVRVSVFIVSFAMIYAVLSGVFSSKQVGDFFSTLHDCQEKKILDRVENFIIGTLLYFAFIVGSSLVISIITVSGAFTLAQVVFESGIKEGYFDLTLSLFQVLMLSTSIFILPELLAQTANRDIDGQPTGKFTRPYLGFNSVIRQVLCMSLGTLVMAGLLSGGWFISWIAA
ncbi:hypothetical protein [Epibacterium ulvae]|uniref:hypothetical protein n=1 Tax=Epibacterium ulvae TaxID=1156985 RepID=UPI00248FCD8D|nr:hypothetical protein [Epibacterium ulvae]